MDVSNLLEDPEPNNDYTGAQLQGSANVQLMEDNHQLKDRVTVVTAQVQVICNPLINLFRSISFVACLIICNLTRIIVVSMN